MESKQARSGTSRGAFSELARSAMVALAQRYFQARMLRNER